MSVKIEQVVDGSVTFQESIALIDVFHPGMLPEAALNLSVLLNGLSLY